MSYQIQQSSTAKPLLFLMIDSGDHISPKTGLSPTVVISKNGAAFASPVGSVTEIGDGWYKLAGSAGDTDTVGPLVLHATAAGADPVDHVFAVVSFNPDDQLLSDVPGDYDSGTAGFALGRLTAASIVVQAPVYDSGQSIQIVRGDDYLATDGRSLDFSSALWPDLTAATVQLTAKNGSRTLNVDGIVVTPTGTKVVRFELTTDDTTPLSPVGTYTFDIQAVLSNSSIVTLINNGTLTVLQDQTK